MFGGTQRRDCRRLGQIDRGPLIRGEEPPQQGAPGQVESAGQHPVAAVERVGASVRIHPLRGAGGQKHPGRRVGPTQHGTPRPAQPELCQRGLPEEPRGGRVGHIEGKDHSPVAGLVAGRADQYGAPLAAAIAITVKEQVADRRGTVNMHDRQPAGGLERLPCQGGEQASRQVGPQFPATTFGLLVVAVAGRLPASGEDGMQQPIVGADVEDLVAAGRRNVIITAANQDW